MDICVVTAADDKYLVPLGVMLHSLLKNNSFQDRKIFIYVIDGGISAEHKQFLFEICSGRGILDFIDTVKEYPVDLPLPRTSTMSTYDRLFLTDTLPSNLEKVLYLDPDIVVDGDLVDLWKMDLCGKAVAAVEDIVSHDVVAIGMVKGSRYFNAGVLLIDLVRWRSSVSFDQICWFFTRHQTPFYDQDALNCFFEGNWQKIPDRWNFISDRYSEMNDPSRSRPVIIHYAGIFKPWNYYCPVGYHRVFLKYFKEISWRGHFLLNKNLLTIIKRSLFFYLPRPLFSFIYDFNQKFLFGRVKNKGV